MTIVIYPAVVRQAEDGVVNAAFVDFSDLQVSAATVAELIASARERLSAELLRLELQGDTWPAPTALGAVDTPAGVSVALIDVVVDDTPIRLTISLGERLLRRIDQDAESRSMTRSGYLALGAKQLLGDPTGPTSGAGGTGHKLQEEVAALGRRVNETLGPESPLGRRLADLDAIAFDGLLKLGGELKSVLRDRSTKPAQERPPSTDGDRQGDD